MSLKPESGTKMRQPVLITGVGGPAGKNTAAYFRARGFFVIGTDVREVPVEVDEFYPVPLALEPSYMPAIISIIRAKSPTLFIPTVTEELNIVARHKDEIEAAGCRVFISPPDAVDIANDKLKTARFLEARGFGVPRTLEGSAPMELVVKELGLPLLAKPVFSRGGRGVLVYWTADELSRERREDIIFQEFIPGEEYDVNLFIGDDGWVLSAVALRKTELKEGITGNAASVERAVVPEVVELAVNASRALGLSGPLDVDIRLRADSTPALLEINARLGGNVLHTPEILDSLLSSWKKEEKTDAIC